MSAFGGKADIANLWVHALATASRRPGSVEEQPACFVMRDHSGQALAYVYFEDEWGRQPCLM